MAPEAVPPPEYPPKFIVPPHPETFDLRFTNVTSIANKYTKVLSAAKGGAHFVAETKHGPHTIPVEARSEAALMTRQHFPCEYLFGPHVKRDRAPGGTGGLAVALGPPAKGNAVNLTPPQGSAAANYFEAGRLMATQITLSIPPRHRNDAGLAHIYVLTLYGDVYKPQEADNLLNAAEDWAASTFPDYPTFILGDFNLETSPTLHRWSESEYLHDLHVLRCLTFKRPVLPTSETRRIDHAWANSPGEALVLDTWIEDLDYATHKTLVVRLELAAFSQQVLKRDAPDPLPTTAKPGAPMTNDRLRQIQQLRQPEWDRACRVAQDTQADTTSRRNAVDAVFDIAIERRNT